MMSSLYVGLSGLTNSSNALNTTANNMANVNTKGYVRQQVVFEDLSYNTVKNFATNKLQQGLGVTIQDVEHVRDILLDEAYRRENGRQGFYDKLTDAVYEIETQLGEFSGVSYQSSISDLLTAINEVAKTPDDNVARAALVQSAVVFLDRSKSIYTELAQYQEKLNGNVIDTVNRINQIGYQVMDLNRKISAVECNPDTAMTLRDERDLLLDELSGYVKTQTTEDGEGIVTVQIEGVFFCDQLSVSDLGLKLIGDTGFYDPVWSRMGDEPLYNMAHSMSTANNTDIGSLKGLLAARGNITPTYYDQIPKEPVDMPSKDASTDPAQYEQDVKAYKEYMDYMYYQQSQEYSVVVRSIANFDKMVNSIMESINDILSPTKMITDDDGNQYRVLDMDKTGYGKDINNTPGTELFSRKFTERYSEKTITVDGKEQKVLVYNEENTFGNRSVYSISSIEINPHVLQDHTLIPLHGADGKVDYSRALELVSAFSDKVLNYGDGLEKLTFEEFYETFVNDISNEGKIYESMVNNQEFVVSAIDNGRQEIMSVSSDDELTNMIRYQQAYNAASRYINVITSMMDSVINMMS